ncbi:MAG: hypothetical protein ACYDCL_06955 [Myxococcales bacterium]
MRLSPRCLVAALSVAACSPPPLGSTDGGDGGAPLADGGTDAGRDAGADDAGPDAGLDAGADAGWEAVTDAGIVYTPYSCADAGFGSPYDRTESFVAPDGTSVVITICGPQGGGPSVFVTPPDAGSSAWLLAAAAAEAVDAGAGLLQLAPGTYDFAGWDGGANWTIAGARDLIVDGQGATLLFHGYRTGFELNGGRRILVRNLTIDWGEPLAVSGTIEPGSARCDGGLAFVVEQAYPIDPAAPLPINVLAQFDPATPGWIDGLYQATYYTSGTGTAGAPVYEGNQLYCAARPGSLAIVDAGSPGIGLARNFGNGVYVLGSTEVALEGVTVFAAPGEGFTFYEGGPGFRMSRCRDVRNPADPARLIATCADGVNFRQTRGSLLLEDSELGGQGDDGVSVVSQFFRVDPSSTPNSLALAATNALGGIDPGDPLTVVSSTSFAPIGSATVASVAPISDGGPATGALVGLTTPGIPILADAGALWDGGLLAFDPARGSPNYIVRGNYVHDHIIRCVLAHGAYGLVEGNLCRNDNGIVLMAQDNFFLEGPGATNVIVRGNRLQGCGFAVNGENAWACQGGLPAQLPAPLSVMSMTFDRAFPSDLPNQNVVLENNLVEGAPGLGLLVASASSVVVRGNAISNANQLSWDAGLCGKQAPLPVGSMVALESSNVTFEGNARDGGSLGLVVDPSCAGCDAGPGY